MSRRIRFKTGALLLAAAAVASISSEALAQPATPAPAKPAAAAKPDIQAAVKAESADIHKEAIEAGRVAGEQAASEKATSIAKEAAKEGATVAVAEEKKNAKANIDQLIQEILVSLGRVKKFLDAGRLLAARREVQIATSRYDEAKGQAARLDEEYRTKVAALSAQLEQQKADVEDANKGCNGAFMCLFAGAFLANYSLTSMWLSPRRGQSGHHIVALVVPTAGFRIAFHPNISFDASLYTAILSKDLQVNTIDGKNDGCRKGGGEFEDRLPCEGNAEARPYGAFNVGFTFGSESLGLISPGLTFGIARTTQDPNAKPFIGFLLGLGQVFTTIKIGAR